jgi:hypothetical protein
MQGGITVSMEEQKWKLRGRKQLIELSVASWFHPVMPHLPSSFNAVEVLPKRTPQDPELGQAELVGLLNLGLPHIDSGLGSIVLIPFHISYGMLRNLREIITRLVVIKKMSNILERSILEYYLVAAFVERVRVNRHGIHGAPEPLLAVSPDRARPHDILFLGPPDRYGVLRALAVPMPHLDDPLGVVLRRNLGLVVQAFRVVRGPHLQR